MIQFGGRPVVGFGLGDQPDPCAAWPFQGLFGYVTELPVLRGEDEQTDQYMRSLNTALGGSCPSMRDVDRAGWQALYQKWTTLHEGILDFLANPRWSGIWQGYEVMAAEYMCRIAAIRAQADIYQKIGAAQCDPKTVPLAPLPPEPPRKKEPSTELYSALKTIAIAVTVTAGAVYVVPRLLPERKPAR
jgi:hypothetical protein